MNEYRVQISRKCIQVAYFELEAPDEDTARVKAFEMIEDENLWKGVEGEPLEVGQIDEVIDLGDD